MYKQLTQAERELLQTRYLERYGASWKKNTELYRQFLHEVRTLEGRVEPEPTEAELKEEYNFLGELLQKFPFDRLLVILDGCVSSHWGALAARI